MAEVKMLKWISLGVLIIVGAAPASGRERAQKTHGAIASKEAVP
jgi:hypothetical protein